MIMIMIVATTNAANSSGFSETYRSVTELNGPKPVGGGGRESCWMFT